MYTTTKEAICPIKVNAGASTNTAEVTPEAGHIIGCVIIEKGGGNSGIVRASIKNQAGEFLKKMQATENYRSREASYLDGCMPLDFQADGSTIYFTVAATANMVTDYYADLIFIYAPVAPNC